MIKSIDLYGWFQWYFRYLLGRRPLDNERNIARRKGIVSSFKGKLVQMIKGVYGRFNDFPISVMIRQVLYHWSYELVEDDLLWFIYFYVHVKMSYHLFNREKRMQKTKDRYHNDGDRERVAEYYEDN